MYYDLHRWCSDEFCSNKLGTNKCKTHQPINDQGTTFDILSVNITLDQLQTGPSSEGSFLKLP
jgi:hypothetical protein